MKCLESDAVKDRFPFLTPWLERWSDLEIFECDVKSEIYDRQPCNLDDHRATVHHMEEWNLYVVREGSGKLELVPMTMGKEHIAPARNFVAGPAPDDDDFTNDGETVEQALSRCDTTDITYVVLHGNIRRDFTSNSVLLGKFQP